MAPRPLGLGSNADPHCRHAYRRVVAGELEDIVTDCVIQTLTEPGAALVRCKAPAPGNWSERCGRFMWRAAAAARASTARACAASEVLPPQWSHVDFDAGEVRLDTSKNGYGRVFPMNDDLRALLKAQQRKRDQLKKAGHIVPWVFFRMVAEGRGGPKKPRPIVTLMKAWRSACLKAGHPGIVLHDLRRSAVRNMVRRGVAEGVAMRLVGHKTRSRLDRYNIIDGRDLRAAAELLTGVAGETSGESSRPKRAAVVRRRG